MWQALGGWFIGVANGAGIVMLEESNRCVAGITGENKTYVNHIVTDERFQHHCLHIK